MCRLLERWVYQHPRQAELSSCAESRSISPSWDLWGAGGSGSPPFPPGGDGEEWARRRGMPSCLLELPLLVVTHPLVRATTLTILN